MPTGMGLMRMPGLEYPANAKLDFSPLERALRFHVEAGFRQAQLDRDAERLGLEQDRFGFEQSRFGQEHALNRDRFGFEQSRYAQEHALNQERVGFERDRLGLQRRAVDREEEERRVTILGNTAETIRGMQDPAARRGAWERFVMGTPQLAELLHRYGVDPTDFTTGPDFIIAQTRDPLARRAVEATTAATTSRAESREMDAETRRLRLLYDQFIERLGSNPTEEAWNRENQPGGLVHAVFGMGPNGVPRAFSEAQSLIQQVQERRRSTTRLPGTDELTGLGFSDEAIRELRRQEVLTRAMGRAPPLGHRYVMGPDNTIQTERIGGDLGTRGRPMTRPEQIAAIDSTRIAIRDARESVRQLSWYQRTFSHVTDIGELARLIPIFNTGARAIMHGLSGAQVNIPETQAWLIAFTPQLGDRLSTIERKLDHMQMMLGFMGQARGANVTDQAILDIRNNMRRAMGLGPVTLQQHLEDLGRGPTAPPPGTTVPPPGVTPPPGTTPRPRARNTEGAEVEWDGNAWVPVPSGR